MEKAKRVRVQLDFTEEQVQELDELVGEIDAASRAEAVRRAVKLCKAVVGRQGDIVFRDKNGKEKEIILL